MNSLIGETKEVSRDVVLLLPFFLVFAATAAIAVANAVADGEILLLLVDVVVIFVPTDPVEFWCWAISIELGEAAVVNKTRLRDATNGANVEGGCREALTMLSTTLFCCYLC